MESAQLGVELFAKKRDFFWRSYINFEEFISFVFGIRVSQLQRCHPYPDEYRNTRGFLLKMDSASYLSSQKELGIILRFRETAYLPLPKANINTYFSRRAKCWLRGRVGGQFPRNVKWSGIRFHTFTPVLENECLKVFNLAYFLWTKKLSWH